MKKRIKHAVLALPLAAALVFTAPMSAQAAEGGQVPAEQHWPHAGIFGTYDKAALQRGFQVYKQVCSSCHAMHLMSYRNLEALGYNEDEIKAIAAEYTVMDGPNDDGEMYERAARPADRFKSPFANDKAARAANGGALPPDLSLVVKARAHGEDYIFSLLTGYGQAPADAELMAGMNWNPYFPGKQIAMAPPLVEGAVTYDDGTVASVEQMARDVTQFLAFAAEPHMEERKGMGIKVILFMLAFAGFLYAGKKQIWAKVH